LILERELDAVGEYF
jgi:hypothetical protein